MKYSKALVERVAELVASDSYTIPEICEQVGIHKSTYHAWLSTKQDFSDAIKKAKEEYNERLIVEARRSLMKKVKGYSEQETKSVYGREKGKDEPVLKEQTITTKHFQPDTVAIIFTLTNKLPDEYKHRQTIDAKVDLENKLGQLSEEQLNAVIDQVLQANTEQNESTNIPHQ